MSDAHASDQLRLTAIHEAGHAVACYRIWGPERGVRLLTIEPEGGDLGRWWPEPLGEEGYVPPWGGVDKEDLDMEPVIGCAGYAAVRAAGYDEETAQSGCASDFDRAARLRGEPPTPEEARESVRRAAASALRLMQEPRNVAAVRALADALIARGTLTGGEIEEIVRGHAIRRTSKGLR